ncbi:MAG: HD domain-containing protein [Candidatus Peregrinibacteria bacterium]
MISKNLIQRIENRALHYLKSAKGSHDFDHTKRVLNLCLHIGKKENADLEILTLAAILHDIGRKEEDDSAGKICHATAGAKLAEKILKTHKIPEDKINLVTHCIACHRFRGNAVPESKEAKILFDADKLDSIGAVGIGRTFLFAGEIGAKLHNSEGVDILKTKPYSPEDTGYREFVIKLSRVSRRMLTREGQRLARERHKFMVEFFERFKREIDGKI